VSSLVIIHLMRTCARPRCVAPRCSVAPPPPPPPPASRRAALAGGAAAALLLAPARRSRAAPSAAGDPQGVDFYQRWPYVEPADILPYLRAHASQGDAAAVLAALEAFSTHYPMYTLGQEKGALLEALVKSAAPRAALEVGTFFGYSAVRTARALPPGSRLLCVEASPANADVARAVLALAGVADVATVITGLAAQALPEAARLIGPAGADFIFLDHCKECYLPDTRQMEALGLLRPGATLVADNVLVPGAPDFLAYVATGAGRFETRLLDAPFEYTQTWRRDAEPAPRDALSVSRMLQPPADAAPLQL